MGPVYDIPNLEILLPKINHGRYMMTLSTQPEPVAHGY